MRFARKKEFIPNDFIAASRKTLISAASPHLHEFFEIEFVISGSGVCCIDGQDYAFSEGSIFFLSPINIHEIKRSNAEIFNVMFRCDGSNESLFWPELYTSCCSFAQTSGEDRQLIYSLLSELVSVYGQDIGYARFLLICLCKKLGSLQKKSEYNFTGYVQRALLYIAENFKNGIDLASVAGHIGLTPTYFSVLFRKELGMNFSSYLDNIRFSYAKNLLCFTDYPILEVSQMSGFTDYTNFVRRFKKMHAMTPTEFRRTHFHAKNEKYQ